MKRYTIDTLALFGSTSRNQAENESDIDILVEFNGRIGLGFIDLAEELEQILGKRVDLVSKKAIKPGFFDDIKGDLIYV